MHYELFLFEGAVLSNSLAHNWQSGKWVRRVSQVLTDGKSLREHYRFNEEQASSQDSPSIDLTISIDDDYIGTRAVLDGSE